MVIDVFSDRAMGRPGVAGMMPRTAMPSLPIVPRSTVPTVRGAEIAAMTSVSLVDIMAGTMIAVGPGTSREDAYESDQRQTDECDFLLHDFLLGSGAGYATALV